MRRRIGLDNRTGSGHSDPMIAKSSIERLAARLGRRPVGRDMLMALADQVLVSGMTFLIGIGVARGLGLGAFGQLAMVLILQNFTQYLQGCFVVAPMMALAGLKTKRSANYYAAVVAWSAALSLAAGLAVALAVGTIYGLRDGALPMGLAASAAAFTAVQNLLYTIRRVLFAQRIGWQALLMDAARYGLFLAALGMFWLKGWSIGLDAVLWALGGSALVALVAIATRFAGTRLRPLLLRSVWGRHWPFAQWLALMMILTFGQEQAIALSLGAVLSDEAIGGLRAGQYLIGITHIVMVSLENFVPGGASRAYAAGGRADLRRYLRETTLSLGLATWGFILLVSLPAEFSLRLTFGEGYEPFAPILRIYALTYAIVFFREVWVFYFYATQRTDVIFRAYGLSFLVAMIVVYPSIKTFGVTGAALTVLLANTVSTAYILFNVWRDSNEPGGGNAVAATTGGAARPS